MIQFALLFSRHGKVRLKKWYSTFSAKDQAKFTQEVVFSVLNRKPRMCNILEWKGMKIIYKRYASLYFVIAIDNDDNELIALEVIHRYVETLDKYFGNVCELDVVFNFDKAYYLLDELILNGELQETSRKVIVHTQKKIEQQEAEETVGSFFMDN